MASVDIDYGDVSVMRVDANTYVTVSVLEDSENNYVFTSLPTLEQIQEDFGDTTIVEMRLSSLYRPCPNIVLSPMIQSGTTYMTYLFYNRTTLVYAPAIPNTATQLTDAFYGTTSLVNMPSIPASMKYFGSAFYGSSASGEAVVRATSFSSYSNAFASSTGTITLYGDKTTCEALAATATNNNVSWSAWYDPVAAVTNRGEGSRTTYTDINRMVRNGVLAVSSYCPARMSYTATDIVHQDEWLALVAAAQTIDTNVTESTHYANLNRIEAAFESAL